MYTTRDFFATLSSWSQLNRDQCWQRWRKSWTSFGKGRLAKDELLRNVPGLTVYVESTYTSFEVISYYFQGLGAPWAFRPCYSREEEETCRSLLQWLMPPHPHSTPSLSTTRETSTCWLSLAISNWTPYQIDLKVTIEYSNCKLGSDETNDWKLIVGIMR